MYSGKDKKELNELEVVFATTIDQQFEIGEHDMMKFHEPICIWLIGFASSRPDVQQLLRNLPLSCRQYIGKQR